MYQPAWLSDGKSVQSYTKPTNIVHTPFFSVPSRFALFFPKHRISRSRYERYCTQGYHILTTVLFYGVNFVFVSGKFQNSQKRELVISGDTWQKW